MNYKKVKKKLAVMLILLCSLYPILNPAACAADLKEGVTQSKMISAVSDDIGYDVVVCVDNSASIWNQQDVRNQAIQGIVGLAVGSDSDIRIGGIYFGKTVGKTMPLTSVKKEEDSKAVLQFFSNTEKDENNKGTNIGVALETAISWFQSSDASRKRVIILFSDGKNDTDAANTQTLNAVSQLKSKNVDFYCVYVQKDQGSDEAYLKSLVNFFENSNANDDRLKSVAEKDINTLPVEFSKIFYAMQNDMQCHVITTADFDADGTYSFNIPDLAVNKLQVNLTPRGGIKYSGKLTSANETDEVDYWVSGSNLFFSKESPAAGEWNLKISDCDDLSAIYGTVAFYTDLKAKLELRNSDGSTPDGVYKNTPMEAVVHFYNADEKEIAIDDASHVTVTVSMTNAEGQTDEKKLNAAIGEDGCVSEPFTLEENGKFSIGAEIQYDDFLKLSYQQMLTADIVNQAPTATDLSGKTFTAQEKEDGMEFQIPVSDLFVDPEGGELTIHTDITQQNRDNPVVVEVEDGVIYVTAQNTGDVVFKVTAEDPEGNSSTAVVQGTVQSKSAQTIKRVLMAVVVIGIVVLILLILLMKQKRQHDKEEREAARIAAEEETQQNWKDAASELEQAFEEYKNAYEKVALRYDSTQRTVRRAGEARDHLSEIQNNLAQELQEERQNLPEEQREQQRSLDEELLSLLGADAVLRQMPNEQISMPADDRGDIASACKVLENMQNKNEAIERMKTAADELRDKKQTLDSTCGELKTVKFNAVKWTMLANWKSSEIERQREMPIPPIGLRYRDFIGRQGATTGWCQLNDAITYEKGRRKTMGEVSQHSLNFWVFGREDAVLLRCTDEFDIQNMNEDRIETVTEKLMVPGTYRIKQNAVDLKLTIEQ